VAAASGRTAIDLNYVERTYRDLSANQRWISFTVSEGETDLYIKADRNLAAQALREVLRLRGEIQAYMGRRPVFRTSLVPLDPDPQAAAIVRDMLEAGTLASVGPMAAVAGAIAEHVGRCLRASCREVIVENGGDIYLALEAPAVVALFAGSSPLSMRIGIRVPAEETPCGICTSSGTVGPSLSFGRADAVTVWARSTALADAAATALANRIQSADDIEDVLEASSDIPDLKAVAVIVGDRIGWKGPLELVRLAARGS
jgi:ApbE superfamily uncharacterized protein (UPF0280 family)